MLGNSHLGALLRAWTLVSGEHSEFELAFAGSASERFRDALVVDGRLRNVDFSTDGADRPLADFDGFVIVADLPPPRMLLVDVLNGSLSRHVESAAIRDTVVESLTADVLRRLIRPHSDRPVVMLSMPERQSLRSVVTKADYDTAVHRLQDEVRAVGAEYAPQAITTMNAQCQPLPEFYRNAVNIEGRVAANQANAEIGHLNAHGGIENLGVVLSILTKLLKRT